MVDAQTVDWKSWLPENSLIKLLYTLQIVEKNTVVAPPAPEEGEDAAPVLTRMSSIEHPQRIQVHIHIYIYIPSSSLLLLLILHSLLPNLCTNYYLYLDS